MAMTKKESEKLWNLLKKHSDHNVEIVLTGDDENNPEMITLEDAETGEVILDANIYTVCLREDKFF